MKKLFLALGLSASLASAVEIASFEISPEIGVSAGKVVSSKWDNYTPMNYGAYARVWLGAFGWVVAPQVKWDSYEKGSGINPYTNTQIGASLGRNFSLVVLRLTPYVGINQSTFSKVFSDTTSYNVGIKLKPALIPLAVSLQYTYQNPDLVGTNTSFVMHNVQVLLGLHF